MLNNKGQTLVIFIIFIPFLLILAAFVIDLGIVENEKIKLTTVSDAIISEVNINNTNLDEVKRLYLKNDIKLEKLEINENELYALYHKDSVFGSVVGIKEYPISIKLRIKG